MNLEEQFEKETNAKAYTDMITATNERN